jgi:hypothetical protein
MSPVHHLAAFGEAIVAAMLADGWRLGNNADYRPDLALDTAQLFEFIGDTQINEWTELPTYYGGDADAAQAGFAKRLDQAISNDGLLRCCAAASSTLVAGPEMCLGTRRECVWAARKAVRALPRLVELRLPRTNTSTA